MNNDDSCNQMRRKLMISSAGLIAGAGLSTFTSKSVAQVGSIDLPITNGHRQLVAFPEKRPLIVLTSRPPQLETPF